MAVSGNTHLADTGTALVAGTNPFPEYPVPAIRTLQNLATNIGEFVVPLGGTIFFQVFVNGSFVPGYSILYMATETGVKSIPFGPVAVPVNGTFALRVTASPEMTSVPIEVSATIETE